MSSGDLDYLNPRMQQAIVEIEGLITSRYPATTFVVTHSDDPPDARVLATVDMDDIDEVLDRSIHRLTQLHVAEELPLSVVPVQTPERLVRLLPRLTRLLADQARRQHEAH